MHKVLQDPIIILYFIVFLSMIIGFIVVFIITYQKKQLLARITIANMQQAFETQLAKAQLEVQEQTLQNVATELHDNVGQLLSLTNVTLGSVDILQTEKAKAKLSDARELVNKSLKELRQLAKLLHGEQLVQAGLVQSIEQELNWLQRKGYYTIELINNLPKSDFTDANKNLFAYRLFQESINNIIKHAEADTIRIKLDYADKKLILIIEDNGKGFPLNKAVKENKGMGLNNMHKRAALIGGEFNIQSVEGKGTTISFTVAY